MKIAVISLTKNGANLAVEIGPQLGADIFVKQEFIDIRCLTGGLNAVPGSFISFVGKLFAGYNALVFIMACGIVVRSIAPYIKDKKTDPAVVVMDEKGKHAISLLSGHMGGANALAVEIARITGGEPIITTATDVNNVTAFDIFAVENSCIIENTEELKYISSELVNGDRVGFYTDCKLSGTAAGDVVLYNDGVHEDCRYCVVLSSRSDIAFECEKTLYIRPKNLILGIGCRKGVTKEQINDAVNDFMSINKRSLLSLKCAATLDLKKDEKGLNEFCSENMLELVIVPREAVKDIEDEFTYSAFVKEKTGVGSVAEPCAVIAGMDAKLICGKTVYPGITLALSEEEKEFYI